MKRMYAYSADREADREADRDRAEAAEEARRAVQVALDRRDNGGRV